MLGDSTKYRTTAKFWECYDALPKPIQQLADKKYTLLKENPRHPSLRLKKLQTGDYWVVRINDDYRALAIEDEDGLTWFWIGDHKTYERIIQ